MSPFLLRPPHKWMNKTRLHHLFTLSPNPSHHLVTTDGFFDRCFPPFPVLLSPLGVCDLLPCPLPDVVFPPLTQFTSSSPSSTLLDGLCKALDHCREVFVWSNDLFILLGTSLLVIWSLCDICNNI